MAKYRTQSFSREFKIDAVLRMFDCDNISALARELGIWRKHLYD